jgi:hypothetical protein
VPIPTVDCTAEVTAVSNCFDTLDAAAPYTTCCSAIQSLKACGGPGE